MIEKEVRGFLAEEVFNKKIKEYTKRFGAPKLTKRLSFAFGNLDNKIHETKIRITNGELEVMQKLGDFDAVSREEIAFNPKMTPDECLKLYRILVTLTEEFSRPFVTVIQHENYIFYNDNLEIKLYRQFGKDEFFAFEVELIKGDEEDLESFCSTENFDIAYDYNSEDNLRWIQGLVNSDGKELVEKEILKLLKKYLSNDSE